MVLANGVYSRVGQASEGTLAAPGYADLALDLDSLWNELDALPS